MVIVVMGPTGAGKTTVASRLAERLGWRFADADDFHTPENVAKMRSGVGLDDADRLPWLETLRRAIDGWLDEKADVVLACSALKRSYREHLTADEQVIFVYPKASSNVLEERLENREGHFAGADLLASQLDALEEPHGGEPALTVDGEQPPQEIVSEIIRGLRLHERGA